MEDIIIIDVILIFSIIKSLKKNSKNSYLLQQANGYLISSFFNDMKDNELMTLLPFLIEISKVIFP